MKKEERRRLKTEAGSGWGRLGSRVYLPEPSQMLTQRAGHLREPTYPNMTVLNSCPLFRRGRVQDQFPSWQKRTRGSFKFCEIFQATMSLE